MSYFKPNLNMISHLSDADKEVLWKIYTHRCLTEHQIMKYLYRIRLDANDRLHYMIRSGLLERFNYNQNESALFLTTRGIETIKFIFADDRLVDTPLFKSYALKIRAKNIDHQIHLNEFALEFDEYANETLSYRYYDEKFMPPTSQFMMPDGMIELSDLVIFLEMDMGNERTPALIKKWESYRGFLHSPKQYYYGKKINLLFIIGGVTRVEIRKRTILASLCKAGLIDQIWGNFEVYINTPDELHRILATNLLGNAHEERLMKENVYKILREKYNYTLSKTQFLKGIDAMYEGYARKLTDMGQVFEEHGRLQEFLVNIWFDEKVSVLRSVLHCRRLSEKIKSAVGRRIPQLIIVRSEQWIKKCLNLTDHWSYDDIFFTTIQRLEKGPLEEAIFSFDPLENLVHYADMSLTTAVHERKYNRI